MLFAWSGFVAGALALLGMSAAAHGYLLVMYWSRHGLYLMERGADDRYHLVKVYALPLVLLRYALFSVAYSLLLLHQRARSWSGPRKPMAVAAKI